MNFSAIQKSYRPELNGLRAVAVIMVLLFHLDLPWMEGGFLGVDIFLVISGYFISKNILYEIQQEKFSFYKFYTRRLRRLFPAMVVTLLLVLGAGYFLMTPADYQRLGLSGLFSALSASNFFFWNESGYFDADAAYKPLLHVWSLSLEEQFYLFWPLCLVFGYRFFRKHLTVLFIIGIALSLLLCQFYFGKDPSATFFLIPFRMFEFILGAMCIGIEKRWEIKSNTGKELLFLLGIIVMFYPAIFWDGATRMPGILSLVPCAGAMLVIVAGNARYASWSLKNKPVELIGKASYSIYLVHWPLIVFYRYWTLKQLTLELQLILGGLSILLGLLMWQVIENQFRYPKKVWKRDPVWLTIPLLIFLISMFSFYVYSEKGIPSRITDELYMTQEEILELRKGYWQDSNSKQAILQGDLEKGHILIFGNSHAIDLIYALRLNGYEGEISSIQTGGKCYNFGIAEKEIDNEFCSKRRAENFAKKIWKKADVIYMHDDWPKWDQESFRQVIKDVRAQTDVPIYVFGPKMVYKEQVPNIVRLVPTINPNVINEKAVEFSFLDLKRSVNDSLQNEFNSNPFYQSNNIQFIDILHLQGGPNLDQFEVVSKKAIKFLYFDAGHFTRQGSQELGAKLKALHPNLFEIKVSTRPPQTKNP